MSDTLLRKLWLDKLPTHTAQILATLPEDLNLLRVAAITDRIVESYSTHISSADSTPGDDTLKKMQQQVKLSMQLERLSRVQVLTSSETLCKALPFQRSTNIYYEKTSGKRRSQQRMKTASAVGGNRVNHLFYINDINSGELFLVDTGAQVSVVSPRANTTTSESSYALRAANGTKIETFGWISLTLNIGLRRSFLWMFTVAQVKIPILGADFLAPYKLFWICLPTS
ncbi:unnamed protein product [Acanthosepion pharaonis]|uniref:Peptidase A2 domain-containing protein n=1 Tax=Acanthosepion pharaonis TaxID=158019 RepID=A0A812D542_ACAPH|nr:unnamed protein product [Sepia pharaonis]